MNASDPSAAADTFNRLRPRNESRVLRVLRREGALSAKSVTDYLRLDKTTVDDLLAGLLEQELVSRDGRRVQRRPS